jgi:copper chaperone
MEMTTTTTRESRFIVSGLNCSGCVGTLTRKAMGVYGVVHVDVDLNPGKESSVTIRHADAVDSDTIESALIGQGYRVSQPASH